MSLPVSLAYYVVILIGLLCIGRPERLIVTPALGVAITWLPRLWGIMAFVALGIVVLPAILLWFVERDGAIPGAMATSAMYVTAIVGALLIVPAIARTQGALATAEYVTVLWVTLTALSNLKDRPSWYVRPDRSPSRREDDDRERACRSSIVWLFIVLGAGLAAGILVVLRLTVDVWLRWLAFLAVTVCVSAVVLLAFGWLALPAAWSRHRIRALLTTMLLVCMAGLIRTSLVNWGFVR